MRQIVKYCLLICILIPARAGETFVVQKKDKKLSATKLKESVRELCAQLLPQSAHTIGQIAQLQLQLMQRLQELLENDSDGIWCCANKQELESIQESLETMERALKELDTALSACQKRCQAPKL